jgi:hypothetical protein
MTRPCAAGCVFAFTLLFVPLMPASIRAQVLTFGIIGDLGYRPEEEPLLQNVLDELNANALDFVVHVGDLSSAAYACTDELLARRVAQFGASTHPIIYTPGDNDWADCHEKKGVKGGDPLRRLARIREIFFRDDQSLGPRTLALVRQNRDADRTLAQYPENARWTAAGVTFLTLNVPGSNNGLGRAPDGDDEFRQRNRANLAWLKQGFETAKANDDRAVMIFQQANIFPAYPPTGGARTTDPNGFTELRSALEQSTIAFRKQVVLVHGDSHFFRIDKPLPLPLDIDLDRPSLENFTRLETFGTPNHHWVEVRLDSNNPNVFDIRQRIVAANQAKRR